MQINRLNKMLGLTALTLFIICGSIVSNNTSAHAKDTNQAYFQNTAIKLINKYRTKHHLKRLKTDITLTQSAIYEANKAAKQPKGFAAFSQGEGEDYLNKRNYSFYNLKDYIGQGFKLPKTFVNKIMKQDKDLLSKRYSYVAVGYKPRGGFTVIELMRKTPLYTTDQFQQKEVAIVNQIRTGHGLTPFTIDPKLTEVANVMAEKMYNENYFASDRSTANEAFDLMDQYGIHYITAGENIAQGYVTPKEVVDGWMSDEGHRDNILNPEYTFIGVGYYAKGNFETQEFGGNPD